MRLNQALARYRVAASRWKSRFDTTRNEMKADTRADQWNGLLRTFRMYNEPTPDRPQQIPPEDKGVQRNSVEMVRVVADAMVTYTDAMVTRDIGNMLASADIMLDGQTIAQGVPAVTLIALENDWRDFRTFIQDIPVAPAGERWTRNTDNVLESDPSLSIRNESERRPLKLSEETDRHPAQFSVERESVPVAEITSTRYHGGMRADEKRALLLTVDRIMVAVQQAKEEANSRFETETVEGVGQALMELALRGMPTVG